MTDDICAISWLEKHGIHAARRFPYRPGKGASQQVTALQIRINLFLTASPNLAAGIAGKLISTQSPALSCATAGMVGKESHILRKSWKYSGVSLVIVTLFIVVQAYVFPGIVPQDLSGANP
jgi:lactate permease